jgi:hypothetical protein
MLPPRKSSTPLPTSIPTQNGSQIREFSKAPLKSETPVKLGTTYVETSPGGVRSGKVIEFERPSKVAFHQPMKLDPASGGHVIDIKVEVTLKENGEGVTTVERDVYLGLPEPLQPLKEAWDKGASGEGVRVLDLLKKYVESLP